jgi:hypothetical protein
MHQLPRMFKRNQVEEACGRLLEPKLTKIDSVLKSRIRRLLETDRSLGRKRCGGSKESSFAFFSREAPGRGVENFLSQYEAFALYTGLRLMYLHRWPQTAVVTSLRRLRITLEKEYARISRRRPKKLFDEPTVHRQARAGLMGTDNIDPVFLAIISVVNNREAKSPAFAICRGQEKLMKVLLSYETGSTFLLFELVSSTHALMRALALSTPRRRGRKRNKV